MSKLKLEIEELAVESFTTSEHAQAEGTVHAYGTQFGRTCGAVNTCGPQTCLPAYCVFETEQPCGGGTVGCPPATVGCPVSGQLSCNGCTTFDYTNQGGDSCDYCLSFQSDSPQRCPCI